jgi:hypothetical protein
MSGNSKQHRTGCDLIACAQSMSRPRHMDSDRSFYSVALAWAGHLACPRTRWGWRHGDGSAAMKPCPMAGAAQQSRQRHGNVATTCG